MGISTVLWRISIGSFCQKTHHPNKGTGSSHFGSGLSYAALSSCIIAILLLCAWIEPNPGPTVAELTRKLDDFIAEYNKIVTKFNRQFLHLPPG